MLTAFISFTLMSNVQENIFISKFMWLHWKLFSLLSVWSLGWSQQSAQHQLFQLDERRFEGEREEERHKHGDEQAPKVEQGQQEPADLHSEGAAIKQVFINKKIICRKMWFKKMKHHVV